MMETSDKVKQQLGALFKELFVEELIESNKQILADFNEKSKKIESAPRNIKEAVDEIKSNFLKKLDEASQDIDKSVKEINTANDNIVKRIEEIASLHNEKQLKIQSMIEDVGLEVETLKHEAGAAKLLAKNTFYIQIAILCTLIANTIVIIYF